MFERLKRLRHGAKTLVDLGTFAERIARERGEERPDVEHLLLACLELPDGSARRALERIGADVDRVDAALASCRREPLAAAGIDATDIDDVFARPPPMAPAPVAFDCTPAARAIMTELAARRGEHRPLRAAHVLAVIADTKRGVPARALTALGVDRNALAVAIERETV